MNVTKLEVIADEDCANIRAGDVVAYLHNDGEVWLDPFGGLFSPDEQAQFTRLAEGGCSYIVLEGVKHPRHFQAHLRVKFKF